MNKLFGMILYDVPTNMRHLYSKIRTALGPNSVLQTWSCRLFPWALHDKVELALESINNDLAKSDRIRYRILLLDQSQADVHEQMVFEALKRMMKTMHDNLRNRIKKADEKLNEAESDEAIPMDKARKIACRKARKELNEAKKLAYLFEVEGALNDSLKAYEKIIASEEALKDYRPSTALSEQEIADQEIADFEKKLATSN